MIDSDDEWLPHFLEITIAFLKWSPEDQFVMTKFLEDWGVGPRVKHDRYEVATKFPRMARMVGSHMMELPAGETDDYLRVYDTRESLGDWGRDIALRAGHPEAALYRGHIFEYMRFGYLGWLPITVLTRKALDTIGLFPENYRTAADYRFLGMLYRQYQANMITLPGAIKHNKAVGGRDLAEAHLATGLNEYRYATRRLTLFDEMFWNERKSDPEINRIRGLYQYYAGRTALEHGKKVVTNDVDSLLGGCPLTYAPAGTRGPGRLFDKTDLELATESRGVLLQRREGRRMFGTAGLQTRHHRLGGADPLSHFGLGESRFRACFENLIEEGEFLGQAVVLASNLGPGQGPGLELFKTGGHVSPLSFAYTQCPIPSAEFCRIS